MHERVAFERICSELRALRAELRELRDSLAIKRDAPPASRAPIDANESVSPELVAAVRNAYTRKYELALGSYPRDTAATAANCRAIAAYVRQRDDIAVIDDIFDAFFADKAMAQKGFPLGLIAQAPERWANAVQSVDVLRERYERAKRRHVISIGTIDEDFARAAKDRAWTALQRAIEGACDQKRGRTR